jgi:diacylglycerol kinase (ATP)
MTNSMDSSSDILFLLNPKASDGQARVFWENARKQYLLLPKDPVDITAADLPSLIKKQRPKIIVIAGGDGTINSVCKVVAGLSQKPLLTIFPLGTGNALSYCLGVETLEKAVAVLQNPDHKITIDLMKTNIPDKEIGVFNIGVGFDARIVFHKQEFKYIGLGAYVMSGLKSLIQHPEREMRFTIDKKVSITATASSLVVANCPVIGQNYIIAPSAKLNDGLLDCTLFGTRYAYITNLRLHGFKHPLYSEKGKVRFKASHLRIEGEPYIQVDGDHSIKKDGIEIEILPKQVTFLRNEDKEIRQGYLPFILNGEWVNG